MLTGASYQSSDVRCNKIFQTIACLVTEWRNRKILGKYDDIGQLVKYLKIRLSVHLQLSAQPNIFLILSHRIMGECVTWTRSYTQKFFLWQYDKHVEIERGWWRVAVNLLFLTAHKHRIWNWFVSIVLFSFDLSKWHKLLIFCIAIL